MASSVGRACRRYLLHLAHEHLEFRIPEIKAIGSFFSFDPKVIDDSKGPFIELEVSEKDAKNLMSRSVLTRSVYELWGKGTSYQELHNNLKQLSPDVWRPHLHTDVSFALSVETFNRTIPQKEKVEKIENILSGHLQFKGPVDLKKPDQKFCIFEYYKDRRIPKTEPDSIYFGRWICDGQRQKVKGFSLQDRKFIANTSMDPGLAMIMANLGKVGPNDLVFDPFVGSGSLLVACAHNGAYVMGSDIDFKLLHAIGKTSRAGKRWRAKDETIRNNLKQYNLEHRYVDALVADASQADSLWRKQMVYDAIITDPPYGVRESAFKLGSARHVSPSEEEKCDQVSQKVEYQMTEILLDLLNLAAHRLKVGGHLVYWLPVFREDYTEENIPQHPCLKCLSNCEQIFSTKVSRRLITMKKTKEPEVLAGTASVEEDHYGKISFRDRYFQMLNKQKYANQEVLNQDDEEIPAKIPHCDEELASVQDAAAAAAEDSENYQQRSVVS